MRSLEYNVQTFSEQRQDHCYKHCCGGQLVEETQLRYHKPTTPVYGMCNLAMDALRRGETTCVLRLPRKFL